MTMKIFPKNDLLFKYIFGDEKDTSVLKAFLQTVLDIPDDDYDKIIIKNPIANTERANEKVTQLDLKLETKSGRLINIEIQIENKKYFRNRSLFYGRNLIVSQVAAGDLHYSLNQAIVILICDFILEPSLIKYHSQARLRYDDSDVCLNNKILYHLLELPKIPVEDDGTILWKFLNFLKSEEEEELEKMSKANVELKKAFIKTKSFNISDEFVEYYRAVEKARRDIAAERAEELKEAVEDGIKQGIEQGIMYGSKQTKKEIALNLLIKKIEFTQILEMTGLSEEELKTLVFKVKRM